MQTIKAKKYQTVFDIAVQYTGWLTACFEIAELNNISVTDMLSEGQELLIPDVLNLQIVNDYALDKVEPATDIDNVVAWQVPMQFDYSVGGGDRGVITAPNEPSSLIVSPTTIAAVKNYASYNFVVTANVQYVVEETEDWIIITSSNTGQYVVHVNENYASTPRSGVITVRTVDNLLVRTITVNQAAGIVVTPTISFSPSSVNVVKAGASPLIFVNANVSYTIASLVSWITVRASGTLGQGYYYLDVVANPNTTTRTGIIQVTALGVTYQLSVSQLGESVTLTLSVPNEQQVSASGVANLAVVVTSNTSFSVQSDSSWITTTNVTSTGFNIVVSNNVGNQRIGHISVIAGSRTETITITQATATAASLKNIAVQIPKLTASTQNPFVLYPQLKTTMPVVTETDGEVHNTWMVVAQLGHNLFTDQARPEQFGFVGSSEFSTFMKRGLEFVYPSNPDTGQTWNLDPTTANYYPPNGKSITEFVSTILPQYRVSCFLQTTIPFANLVEAFDAGASQSLNGYFGQGDWENGKSLMAFVGMDWEGAVDEQGYLRKFALQVGACLSAKKARVFEFYSPIFETFSGVLLIDHTRKYDNYPIGGIGVTYPSTTQLSPLWKGDIVLNISEKGIAGKKITDYPQITPTQEQAFYRIDLARHLSVYDLGNNKHVTIRKYGDTFSETNQPNTFNVVGAFLKYAVASEQFGYYCQKVLNRRGFMQGKNIGDCNNAGLADYVRPDEGGDYVSDVGAEKSNELASREDIFLFDLCDYMNGNHQWKWTLAGTTENALYNRPYDGHIGSAAIRKMVVDSGGAAIFEKMNPLFWNISISTDGINYVNQNYAIDLNRNINKIWVRAKVGTGNYSNILEVAAARPERVEPTEVWVKVLVQNVERIIHITPTMWETLNPIYSNVSSANISTEDKIYFYQKYQF